MSLVIQEHGREKADRNIALLVAATLSYNIITLAVNLIMGIFLPNTPIDTVLCLGVYAYFLIRALPALFARATSKDVIFILVFALLIAVSMLKESSYDYVIESLAVFPRVILYSRSSR